MTVESAPPGRNVGMEGWANNCQPEVSFFQEAFDKLKQEGIWITEPRRPRTKAKGHIICSMGLTTIPIEEATLGDLDCALKAEGYFLMDGNYF